MQATMLKWQQKKGNVNVRLKLDKYFNKHSDKVEKIELLLIMSSGYIARNEKGFKGTTVPKTPVHSEEYNRLFGSAFESYLTKKYEQALILSRKLHKSAPHDKRANTLYYKCLEKLIEIHEGKQDYRMALSYIACIIHTPWKK